MNSNEIIQLLRNNKACNFIGIAITPLHSNGIDAVLRYLGNRGEKIEAEIFVFPHGVTGYAISKKNFITNGPNINYNYMKQPYIELERKASKFFGRIVPFLNQKAARKTIYIAWTKIDYKWIWMLREAYGNINIVYMIIDDGAATYENPFFNARTKLLYKCGNSGLGMRSVMLAKEWLFYKYDDFLSKIWKRNGKLVTSSIFLKQGDNYLKRNAEFTDYYIDVLRIQGKEIPEEIVELCENAVLFNTQCLFENNIMTHEQQLSYYSDVAEIINEMDYKMVVKPHPRETAIREYLKVGFRIIDEKQYSQESIIASCTTMPICVISIFSSTLLNAYGLFGISAISLAKIVMKDQTISNGLRRQLEEYINKYEGILLFPSSYDELKSIVLHEKSIREGSNNE